jgi:hypothetical protein
LTFHERKINAPSTENHRVLNGLLGPWRDQWADASRHRSRKPQEVTMSHKTIIATAATVVGISALTSTAVFAHGGGGLAVGGHFGGGTYSVPHMPMTSMPRAAAVQSVGKLWGPPASSTHTAQPPRFLGKAPAVPATRNPTIFDKAKQVAAGARVPATPNPTILDKAKQIAAGARVPATPNPTILDKAKQVAAGAQVPATRNPTIFDKAKQVAAGAQVQAIPGPGVQTPAGTGGRVADQIPTVPVCCKPPPPPPPPPPHDPDNRPGGRPGWGFPVGGVVVVDPGVDGYPVSCLRKQYLPDGNVVFIDVCRNEVVPAVN